MARSRTSLFGVVPLLLAACHTAHEEEKPPPLAVEAQAVQRGDVADVVEATGTLDAPPGFDVKLGALVGGRLAQVLVAEGDAVAQGALLARLDQTPYRDGVAQVQAQLAQAIAQQKNADVKLDRAEKAVAAGVAARQEADDARLAAEAARAAVTTARAQLSTAKNQLARSELHAPFAGTVAHVFAAVGEPMDGSGKPIVEVARTVVLELRGAVPPARAAGLRKGQSAQVVADGFEKPFPATVAAIAPVVDPATGGLTVRVRVPNESGALRAGVLGRARIVVDVHRAVLVVPQKALVRGEAEGAAQTDAVVVIEGGKALRKQVEVGYQDGERAEIRAGLSGGEQVILQNNYALPDGTPVRTEAADAGRSETQPTEAK